MGVGEAQQRGRSSLVSFFSVSSSRSSVEGSAKRVIGLRRVLHLPVPVVDDREVAPASRPLSKVPEAGP